MFQVDIPMAGVTIETERREPFIRRVDRGRVATGAAIGVFLSIPGRLLQINPFFKLLVPAQHRLNIEQRKFSVTIFFEKSHVLAAAHNELDISRITLELGSDLRRALSF